MIIIADSGSSKTDWRFVAKNGQIEQAKTMGINPYIINSKEIVLLLKILKAPFNEAIEAIYYYGAGCDSEQNIASVESALQTVFSTKNITINNDLLAAARACCADDPGLVGILGTGANGCVYDGTTITQKMTCLGYALGDEGSGAYIGKIMLKAYLENELPNTLRQAFKLAFPDVSKSSALHAINHEKNANRYLAGFFRFAATHQADPFISKLIKSAFDQYVDKSFEKFDNYDGLTANFVGGVAFYASNILQQVLKARNFTVGRILESPIAGLTLYHQKQL